MIEKREEPQVLLDKIISAVRGNRRLDLEFRDNHGKRWILSLKKVEE